MPFTCGPRDGAPETSLARTTEEQAPETIADAVEEYLTAHPTAVVIDDGRVRVRWHHLQGEAGAQQGVGWGAFQRVGYFGGVVLSREAPKLYLLAPALRVYSATEVVLRYLTRRVN